MKKKIKFQGFKVSRFQCLKGIKKIRSIFEIRSIRVPLTCAKRSRSIHVLSFAILSLLVPLVSHAQPTQVTNTGIDRLRSSTIAKGDINNDGYIDLVVSGIDDLSNYVTQIYTNDGDNTFTDIGANIISVIDGDIALADFNGDNYLDIAITGQDQTQPTSNKITRIYKNNQNSTFSDISAGLTGLYKSSLAWADYDNDGDLDLFACGQDASNTRMTFVCENTGSENFIETAVGLPGVKGHISCGDINLDGYIDVAISGLGASNNYITEFYINDKDKTFSAYNANLNKLAFSNHHLIDYDNDGDLDFWIAGTNNAAVNQVYLYNNNAGNFQLQATSFSALWEAKADWSDYDADGDADLIYIGLDGITPTTYYYRNDGAGSFVQTSLGIIGIAEGDICWLDVNNDNKQDILVSGSASGGSQSNLYLSNEASANTAPSAPSGLTFETTANKTTLSWTASTDTETASDGLSYRLSLGTASGNYDIVSPMANIGTGSTYLPMQGLIKGTSAIIEGLTEGVYYWRIQAIDASGKASALSAEATIAICAPINIGADKTICTNNLLELSAGTASDIVNWYSENEGQIATNTNNLSHTITQDDKIWAAITKPIGCTVRDTIEVTTLALPSISLPATAQDCFGKTLTYTAVDAGETVKWYAQNGNLLHSGSQIDYEIADSETIKCEVTAANTCLDSAKIAITSLALPEASLGEDFGICNSENASLEITGMQTVNWYALPWTQIGSSQSQISIAVTSDTTIVAQFTGSNGCVNSDTITIAANNNLIANAGNDTIICYNTNLVLGGNIVASNGQAPYTYAWTNESGQQISDLANPTVEPGSNTYYDLQISDANGCEGTDKITVSINPQTTIDLPSEVDICYGNSIELGGNPTAEGSQFEYTYSWWPETGLDDAKLANPNANPLDTTTYRFLVTSYKCEAETAYVTVNVMPLPEITITEDFSIGFGETIALEASGGTDYEWSPAATLSSPNSAITDASPQETSTYVVNVTDEQGCKSEASVTVTVKNDFFIPSLFTPNGDGNNDFFRVYGIGIESLNMAIYNRNGNVVFESSDVNFLQETGWDGTTNGTKQPQGSYMFVVSGRFVDGKPVEYKGAVSLLR